jgi:hypothetical protein
VSATQRTIDALRTRSCLVRTEVGRVTVPVAWPVNPKSPLAVASTVRTVGGWTVPYASIVWGAPPHRPVPSRDATEDRLADLLDPAEDVVRDRQLIQEGVEGGSQDVGPVGIRQVASVRQGVGPPQRLRTSSTSTSAMG